MVVAVFCDFGRIESTDREVWVVALGTNSSNNSEIIAEILVLSFHLALTRVIFAVLSQISIRGPVKIENNILRVFLDEGKMFTIP